MPTRWGPALLLAAAGLLGGGCGAARPAASPPARPVTAPYPRSAFPSLIRQALQPLAAHPGPVPLYAPATYPGAAHTPLPVTAAVQTGSRPVPFYQVRFERGGGLIGSFAVARWPDAAAAARARPALPVPFPPYPPRGVAVPLVPGVRAVEETVAAASGLRALVWTTGRWRMAVVYGPGQGVHAREVARRIRRYLPGVALPAPAGTGWAVTVLEGEDEAWSYLHWSRGRQAFSAAASGPWNSNLSGGYLAAFAMAAATHPYA
ncbi:conserved protein of unknown function [Candidatus Hydrogenisulfobacillus filiaventi]|uniref:Uncharacterized protein n=1 Tax=Candidatus Hydrogenisulfobacillus filiaventi TaxID=2707344 RepID=A0A6F8ZHW3_9FIRM|nr:conserved protein of unknown function [Candidatus Hydrogenisulfobacillus filiaventi]